MLKKILKVFAWALGLCLVLIFTLAVVVWLNPGLLLNEANIAWVVKWQKLPLTWKTLDVDAKSPSFWTKTISLAAEDLCYEQPEGVSACFHSLGVFARAWISTGLIGYELEKIQAVKGEIVIPSPPDEKTGETSPPKRILVTSFDGKGKVTDFQLKLNAGATGIIEAFPHLKASDCVVRLKNLNRAKKRVGLECPVTLTAARDPKRSALLQTLMKEISVGVGADFNVDTSEPHRSLDGTVELSVDPLARQRIPGTAVLKAKLAGKLDSLSTSLTIDSDLRLAIPDFQKLVAQSRDQLWAIPAPFNTLTGSLNVNAQAKGNLETIGLEVPVTFQTRLQSASQRLDLDSTGKLTITKSAEGMNPHLDLSSTLTDVTLVLPELTRGAPPRLVPDARIGDTLRDLAKEEGPSRFTYAIKIVTPEGKPVRLVSNLVSKPVPIALALDQTSNEGTKGTLSVSQVPVELFRRKAILETFRITLDGKPENTRVYGAVRIDYTDYTINILVQGKLAEPQIELSSVPPLPEDQVLAVLLFGKTKDALDIGETRSVGNTQAAITEGAVSLASMYLLASTPVESVGYDPMSRSFTAKIRLADGTSLNVGTNLKELQQIGLRKRLGRDWAITTYLENPLAPLGQSITAFLEWSKAY